MNTLNFDTGIVKHSINGKYEVEFNPTDVAFAERLGRAFDELERKQESKRKEIESASTAEVFDLARKWDAEMREVIDEVFGGPLCASVFGNTSVYALANGLPLWANLMIAVMDEMDMECLCMSAIVDGHINAQISHEHRLLVLSPRNPFPRKGSSTVQK